MEFKSSHRFARISPSKVRPVADLIRSGRENGTVGVNEAMEILRSTPKRASYFLLKTLRSAVANATEKADADSLYVKEARVGDGPRVKRGRPRARGAYFPLWKRTCHIWVTVAELEPDSEAEDT